MTKAQQVFEAMIEKELTRAINELKRSAQVIQSLCPAGFIHPALGSIHAAIADFQDALAHPPQRTWVGLTDEEHIAIHDKFVDTDCYGLLIDAVEAKLKEKNT